MELLFQINYTLISISEKKIFVNERKLNIVYFFLIFYPKTQYMVLRKIENALYLGFYILEKNKKLHKV